MRAAPVAAFLAGAVIALSAGAAPCFETEVDEQLRVWTGRGVAPACRTPDDTFDIERMVRDGDADDAIAFATERECIVLLDRDMVHAVRVHHYDFVAVRPISMEGEYVPEGMGEFYVSTMHLTYLDGARAAGLWRKACEAAGQL